LTGGEAHDCPPAKRLIRRTRAARTFLGDKAYDSAELRNWLKQRGSRAVIPNKANRKQPFRFDKASYKQRHRIENAFVASKTSVASPRAMTGLQEISSRRSASSPLSYGGLV
jgi:transposase